MRKSVTCALVVLGGVVGTSPAKTRKEAPLPQLFCQGHYVYVQTYEGAPDAQIARAYPGDYDAAVGVQQRIASWDRYKLVYEQQQADLVFVVWKARPQGNRLPGQPTQMPPVTAPQIPDPGTGPNPGNPQGRPGQAPGGMGTPDGVGVSHGGPGVAAYPVNDQLAVYAPDDASLLSPLWKKSEKDGLKTPRMTLFGDLADAVDDACANPTSSQ
jgi:hypothetical protein